MATISSLTLNLNEFFTTMTNLISFVRLKSNIAVQSPIERDVVDTFTIGSSEYGDTVIFRIPTAQPEVTEYSKASELLKVFEPKGVEESFVIDNIKQIKMTLNEMKINRALMSGMAYSAYASEFTKLIDSAKSTHLFNSVINNIWSWKPVQTSQTITITNVDRESTVGENTISINNFAQQLKILRGNLELYLNKYTDVPTTYTKLEGDRELVLLLNAKYNAKMVTDSLASLYNGMAISDLIKAGKIIEVPTEAVNEENKNTIAIFCDKEKFPLVLGADLSGTFLDIDTWNEQHRKNFSYGTSQLKNVICIKFVAEGW